MKDERIEQATNKVRSEMFIIIYVGVAVSFIIKILVFDMPLQDRLPEYLILILSPLYQFVRMHLMKVSLYSTRGNKQSLKIVLAAIAIFLAISAMSIFKSGKGSAGNIAHIAQIAQNSVPFIIGFLVLFAVIYFTTNKFNEIKGHEYEKEFDDDK